MNDMLNAALDLARRGFKVFPLIPGTKRPAIENWQSLATTDEVRITAVWSKRAYNIGVLCGQGLVVLDVDVKNGKSGMESLAALDLDLDTYTVETPTGGLHVYYQGPDVSNSAGRLGEGLDIRSAGGYVVGVGSVCEDRSYRLVRNGGLRMASEDFLARCGDTGAARSNGVRNALSTPAIDLDDEGAIARARDYLQSGAPAYGSFSVAARVRDFGVSESVALDLMLDHWNRRRPVPHSDEALAEKVEHAYRYGQNPPGSDHPAVLFAGVHVDPPPEPAVAPIDSRWYRHGDGFDINARWAFYGIAAAVGTLVIVGPSNAGKTFVELEMARCLATGKPFFGVAPDALGGTGMLFAGTEGSALPRRLAALQEPETLPISAMAVRDLSGRGALDTLAAALKEESARMQLLFGVPLRMVVLETLSASGLLVDEQSNAEAGRAMANLGQIARMLNILFVTTHHPPKEGRGARGAGAITASADYVLEIFREGRETLRRLDLVKARDAEQKMIGTFTLVPVQLGVDDLGRPVTSMSVSMGDAIKPTVARAPSHLETFARAVEFAEIEGGEKIEGVLMVERQAALDEFKSLLPDMNRSNRHKLWQKCLDFSDALDVIEQRVANGTQYLIRKEIVS